MIETVIPCLLCFIAGAIVSPLLYLEKLCKKSTVEAPKVEEPKVKKPKSPKLEKHGVFKMPLYNGLSIAIWDSFTIPGYIAVSVGPEDTLDGDIVYYNGSHIEFPYGRKV